QHKTYFVEAEGIHRHPRHLAEDHALFGGLRYARAGSSGHERFRCCGAGLIPESTITVSPIEVQGQPNTLDVTRETRMRPLCATLGECRLQRSLAGKPTRPPPSCCRWCCRWWRGSTSGMR